MRCVTISALFLWSISGIASEDVEYWFKKMADAMETLNYEGTFVFMHDNELESMHVIHRFDQEGIKKRLVSLNGEPREIIQNSNVLTCVWPESNVVVVEADKGSRSIPDLKAVNLELVSDYYDLKVGDEGRVAGAACRYIDVKPIDQFRYGYRMCIGELSGMLLLSETKQPTGEPIEQVMFTNFTIRENIPDEQFESTLAQEHFTWHPVEEKSNLSELEPDPGWKLGKMPPGFHIRETTRRPMAASVQPVQHIILTDGLASVSIFIAKTKKGVEVAHTDVLQSGATHVYGRELNGHEITVVGQVPAVTVKLVGESLNYQQFVQK